MSSAGGELAAPTELEQWTYLRELPALSLPSLKPTISVQTDVKRGSFYSVSVSCFLSYCGLQLSIRDVLRHYEIVTAAEETLCYKHAIMQ